MNPRTPPSELKTPLRDEIEEIKRDARDGQRFGGDAYLRIYEKIVALFQGLGATVAELVGGLTYTRAEIDTQIEEQDDAIEVVATNLSNATWDASRIVSGTIQPARGGTGTTNAYENDLSAVTRRTAWVSDAGVIGHAPSSRETKQDIRPAPFDLETLRKIEIVLYRYRWPALLEQTSVVKDGFKAATEIGAIAEDLHTAGLWPFVVYEGHGETAVPVGIHVELLGLAGILLGQAAHDRLDAIERRLDQNGND